MESEKVKEIKKALEICQGLCNQTCPYYSLRCMTDLSKDALTLINELESRISELENGIAKSMLGCEFLPECTHDKLKQFTEMLKEKAIRRQEFIGELAIEDIKYVKTQDIDETLKEFKKGKVQNYE